MLNTRNIFKEVVAQLHLAVVSWTNQQTTTLIVGKFEEMIKVIYLFLQKAPKDTVVHLLQSQYLTDWIWHGSGFASPEKIALESRFPKSINVYPYLFRLPNELFKVKEFLLSHGVKQQFEVDDLLDMLFRIKEKHDNGEQPPEEVNQDLDRCRAVLEWIIRSEAQISEERRCKLLIPVQCQPGKLQLEPCNNCTYCDREFLRRGVSEHQISFQSHLIHKAISEDLASHLQVPRLSSCLAGARSIGIKFKEAGQYEPLTTRLRNILQQYKEGVAIFKEVIQNADDARASKVCFVVDWRENPRERLLTEELAECQGPALWAYNDAKFTDKDFENINKLAGETKKEDLDKVGRFGLGFNSVYHLTDVPSFLSGEHIVFFDPNMTHISNLLEAKMRQGGVMLSLKENKDVRSAFPDQFLPYDQLFGCDMTGTGTFDFKGTLFRFPFRTQKSEISNEPYTPDNVRNLIKSLKESASTLLLFAQNVKEVQVYEIQKNSTPKRSLGRPIIRVTKSIEKTLYTNVTEGSILRNSSIWLSRCQASGGHAPSEGPRCTELLKMNVSLAKSDLSGMSEAFQQEDMWLVNSCTGERSSLQVAQSVNGKRNAVVPVTGVAVKMTQSDVHGTKIFPVTGEVFCFMPLSIESGFPVHVNGSFSVYQNRRRLWEECVGEHHSLKPFEAKWNEALMKDSLVQSYLQLLERLKSFNDKKYKFHSLWPNPTKLSQPKAWNPFLISFFNQIIDEEWPLFYCNGKWTRLHNCLILDPKLNKVAECVTIMNLLGEKVVSIPQEFLEAFKFCGKEAFIKKHMLTEDRFLREFFFPNAPRIPIQHRNSVLVHILDRRLKKHVNYDELLGTHPCFSCSKDGTLLRTPKELIHPKGKAAPLFCEEEKRFPLDERFLTKERAMMLEELGMVIDSLPWSVLCERAQWVSNHADRTKAGLLIQFMNKTPPQCKISEEQSETLRAAKFLPILSKPKDYPFSWKSDQCRTTHLAAANHLYPERHKNLVGSSQLILDESSNVSSLPNHSLKKILGFTTKQPQLSDVMAQLDLVIQFRNSRESICLEIYKFFQKVASSATYRLERPYLREQLERRPWLLIKDQMVYAKFVARNWRKEDGSPYLFGLPLLYTANFNDLLNWYGIKESFDQNDIINAISNLREDIGRRRISENQIRTLIVLLEEVFSVENDPEITDTLPLPSSVDDLLYDADELVINETPWLETDGRQKPVHEKIPAMLAYKCGAKKLRDADLAQCSEPIGQPFGQHEELTDRLKNILKGYPADVGILKELVQNADDAKASEIHFVFDPRTHDDKNLFSDKWKDLQGPAICVYNNKPFSEEDIEGIQKLGIGSKVDDPLKTGQYGIGFNAVYHLTDCPYFISNDEVICVSDPHIAYVPGATERKPGRLFKQFDKRFRRNYQGVFSGFLGDLFKLKGSTMFRFPLRRSGNHQSKISTNCWNDRNVTKLFDKFRLYANDMLLFLNHVNKISVSVIKNGKLETYSVACDVSDQDKRAEFFEKMKACSGVRTVEIPWQQVNYVMKISDTNNVKTDWLVIQSLGHIDKESNSDVPDGASMGLLPRAGIAISLSSTETHALFRHSVFCVLPLPVSTKFPAHINGHFALDSSRRKLWDDPKSSDARVLWNNFMKRHVIAPAYASAICHARNHIVGLHIESDNSGVFPSEEATENGLRWYHQLFPSIACLDSEWEPVGQELFKNFLSKLPVLPVAMSVPRWKKPVTENSSEARTEQDQTPVTVSWCTVSNAYFCTSEMTWLLEKTLLSIGFLLLSHTPSKVHESFKTVKQCHDVCPVQVRNFLLNCEIQDGLPTAVENTVLRHVHNIYELTKYCAKAEDFFESLEGVPLLLQQDGVLRCFNRRAVVFYSRFGRLLPFRSDLFLHESIRFLYANVLKKCSNVLREFRMSDLAMFQAYLFPPAWINTDLHQPWNPNEQDDLFPSKEWLKLLWEFIDDVSKKSENEGSGDNTSTVLNEIAGWHIFPTNQNCLVPVFMGKTVLNVSTFLNSDSSQDRQLRALLVKLRCPQLNHTLLISSSSRISSPTGATAVRKHYLAMVQSTKDVLGLLDQTLNGETRNEATLQNEEIERILTFLQSDLSNLSYSTLRNLPFYQTISGTTYTRLPENYEVFEVPDIVPRDDLQTLSTVTNIIFLRHAPKLAELYSHIQVKEASSMEFYIRIVLTHFNHLSTQGRLKHLEFVRDFLLHKHCSGYNNLLAFMKQLPCIPDRSGELRRANEFYKPSNKVFKKFLPNDKFPPEPFDSSEWKEFLTKIGLQCSVTMELFLTFATQLQEEARNLSFPISDEMKEVVEKSNCLVSHLFENQVLHSAQFLSQISTVKFVPAVKIQTLYLKIHSSHTDSILTCYNGSVVESRKALVWSSASLVATSAVPHRRDDLFRMLGLHKEPPLELVLSHVKNISGQFPATANRQIPSELQTIVQDVMTKIYSYFKNLCVEDINRERRPNCTHECIMTSKALRKVPVILVDQHTFVRGNQLAFDRVWNSMNPYMFNVPRHLQCFEHFLKCLGAQECPTPLQYSSVLKTIKESCGDNKMHPGEVRAATDVTKCLFLRLSHDNRRSQTHRNNAVNVAQSLENVQNFYLPTEGNYLKPSCEVFVNDTMERKERLKDYWNELLIDLTMRDQERPAKLVELLPDHLKVKKLSSIVNEELSPTCIDQICILDQDPNDLSCDFIKRYRDVICSREFTEALIRLYKFQQDSPTIPEEVRKDLQSLENGVKVSCMQTIEVHLVTLETREPIPGSGNVVPTFCRRIPNGYSILIKHGEARNSSVLHERLSSFIANITGQHIREACWRFVMMILGVDNPSEISGTLDNARVPRNISTLSREPNAGDKIPECLHYLLKNDINYYLRDGEWVGYEVAEEDEENEEVYVFAKIIEQTHQGKGFFNDYILLAPQGLSSLNPKESNWLKINIDAIQHF